MKFAKKTIVFSTLIGVLSIPVLLFLAGWLYFASISETLVSWNTPQTREQALATHFGSTLGLPISSKEIYAFYRNEGTQQNLVYIRFSAKPEDIELFIQHEFERHHQVFPKDQLLRLPISKSTFDGLPWALSRPRWWKPETITNGFYIAIDSGLGPRFWIDSTTNMLYYYDFS